MHGTNSSQASIYHEVINSENENEAASSIPLIESLGSVLPGSRRGSSTVLDRNAVAFTPRLPAPVKLGASELNETTIYISAASVYLKDNIQKLASWRDINTRGRRSYAGDRIRGL